MKCILAHVFILILFSIQSQILCSLKYCSPHQISFRLRRNNQVVGCTSSTSPSNEYIKEEKPPFYIKDLTLSNFLAIMQLTYNEFSPTCNTVYEKMELLQSMIQLFLPKLVRPLEWKHRVIGIVVREELVAFADVSLQPCSGTMEALTPIPFEKRKTVYENDELKPYICNFLVAPAHRKKGYAKVLIKECENFAKCGGFNEIFLHVKTDTTPAFSLYLSQGFEPVQLLGESTLFMKKSIRS